MKKEIILKKITKNDYDFLYELLKSRDSRTNISHKSMPTYKEHVKFIESKPYKSWYIIIFETSQIGSIYLSKQDEIGIFILQNFHDIGLGQLALDELININPCERYLANVNPKNSKSIKFFEKNNFKLIQHTYELVGRKKSNETKN
jgi:RimJ/RimL family protein N-acetyltransferase